MGFFKKLFLIAIEVDFKQGEDQISCHFSASRLCSLILDQGVVYESKLQHLWLFIMVYSLFVVKDHHRGLHKWKEGWCSAVSPSHSRPLKVFGLLEAAAFWQWEKMSEVCSTGRSPSHQQACFVRLKPRVLLFLWVMPVLHQPAAAACAVVTSLNGCCSSTPVPLAFLSRQESVAETVKGCL